MSEQDLYIIRPSEEGWTLHLAKETLPGSMSGQRPSKRLLSWPKRRPASARPQAS